MSATLPQPVRPDPVDADAGTRQRVLQLVASSGPVAAPEIAARLDLTPAAIRRHLGVLEQTEQIAVHEQTGRGPARRGRPARRYVATNQGQAALSHTYSELAADALRFLAETGGASAVEAFAERRVSELEQRLSQPGLEGSTTERVHALADALSADGYAASARPVPGGHAVQLCQGHCPVQDVAHEFPQLCEAEARAFSRLLGVHVQRLATLASGGHVCTTNIPVIPLATSNHAAPSNHAGPVLAPEGTNA
ncbi:MAG: helix-turn-helix domain-containing protein [Brevundimonas sp.]